MGVIDAFVYAHDHHRRNMDPMFRTTTRERGNDFQG